MPYTVAELSRYGFLGEDADETPTVKALPWDIDKPAPPPSAGEISEKRWNMAATVIGVVGGMLGIVLSYRAFSSGKGG